MADKDDLLAELIFKKHQERALARQAKSVEIVPKNEIIPKKILDHLKQCPKCEWPEPHCTCGTSAVFPSKAKAKEEYQKNLTDRFGIYKGQPQTAKPHFFTQRAIIPAGGKLTLEETVRQIICITNVSFKCDGPILLSDLIFVNTPQWPLGNEIHIGMQCSFDIANQPVNCGSRIQVTVQNLDGARAHEIFIMYTGVTLD